MNIKILIDNNENKFNKNFSFEEALSIYVKTDKRKILIDTGSNKKFIANADILGVDIAKADYLIISHAHYDHTGGICSFIEKNNNAKIYISKDAFNDFYFISKNNKKYIGIPDCVRKISPEKFIYCSNFKRIEDNIILFGLTNRDRDEIYSNSHMYVKINSSYEKDNFNHEINVLISEKDKKVLFAGCAHAGIYNIIKKSYEISGSYPDYVIGGFHLPDTSKKENIEFIKNLGYELNKLDIKYITGHCTSFNSFKILKEILKDKIDIFCCGFEIEI